MATTPSEHALALATQQFTAGRLNEAEGSCRQILAEQPNYVEALHLLGCVLSGLGHQHDAIDIYHRALFLQPENAFIYQNLGVALRIQGRFEEAIAACQQAISIRPNFPEAFYNLGMALRAAGRLSESITAYQRAITLRPDDPNVYNNLGNALSQNGQHEQAIVALQTALSLQPDSPDTLYNLGRAFQATAKLEEAIAAFERALKLQPNDPEICNDLGLALFRQGRWDEAITYYRRALSLRPDFAIVHWNLGVILMMKGELTEGWREFQWRWRIKEPSMGSEKFFQTLWDGSELAGRRILLHHEWGFGDTLQYIRYVPLVAERGGKITLQCPPELLRLFQRVPGIEQIVRSDGPPPDFELQCPLPHLPSVFNTTMDNIPSTMPYLFADPELVDRWKARVGNIAGRRLKIGVVWATRYLFPLDRSTRLEMWAPLANIPGTWFCSLQKGEATVEERIPPEGFKLTDWTNELKDFADTAALIANLDLVISVNTAVPHLAAAMGKPVWTLLSFVPGWQWILNRNDSPWYPTMRLFRQPRIGDWQTPIQSIAQELKSLAKTFESTLNRPIR